MANYTLPDFGLAADVWNPPATPAANPPTFTGVHCQVYTYSRTPQQMLHPGSGRWLPVIIIRLPITYPVQIRIDSIWTYTAITQPQEYLKVQYVNRMHTGFANQYWAAYCLQCNANGTIPRLPVPT